MRDKRAPHFSRELSDLRRHGRYRVGKKRGQYTSFTTKRVTAVLLKIIAVLMATINAIAGINYCGAVAY